MRYIVLLFVLFGLLGCKTTKDISEEKSVTIEQGHRTSTQTSESTKAEQTTVTETKTVESEQGTVTIEIEETTYDTSKADSTGLSPIISTKRTKIGKNVLKNAETGIHEAENVSKNTENVNIEVTADTTHAEAQSKDEKHIERKPPDFSIFGTSMVILSIVLLFWFKVLEPWIQKRKDR